MTTTRPTCDACTRPVADNAHLCQHCADKLTRELGDVPSLTADLEVTRTRQSRTGGLSSGTTSRSAETLLPWSEPAAEAVEVLRSTLAGWCRLVSEERGLHLPADDLPAMSRYLLLHADWLRHHPDAAEALDELLHAIWHARHIVDRRPDRLYAGPCDPTGEHHPTLPDGQEPSRDDLEPGPCRTDLYAVVGREEVTCPRCDLIWRVKDRREHLLEAATDQLVTAADLSKFLTAYGEPLTVDRIYQWVSRGHLTAHGHDGANRPLYRVGDATDVLARIKDLRKKASA